MEGATTLGGRDVRQLYDKLRTVREAEYSGMSGISCSWLCERLSSVRLGSSSRQRGICCSSLCWRSSFTNCVWHVRDKKVVYAF